MMWITESDVSLLEDFSTATIAAALGIEQALGGSPNDRLSLIDQSDPEAAEKLRDFHAAYRDWFSYHLELDQMEVLADQAILKKKMERRDSTREDLLAYRGTIEERSPNGG